MNNLKKKEINNKKETIENLLKFIKLDISNESTLSNGINSVSTLNNKQRAIYSQNILRF